MTGTSQMMDKIFQSTLPRGSDNLMTLYYVEQLFQSTLPRGSDADPPYMLSTRHDFNPRYREVATLPE